MSRAPASPASGIRRCRTKSSRPRPRMPNGPSGASLERRVSWSAPPAAPHSMRPFASRSGFRKAESWSSSRTVESDTWKNGIGRTDRDRDYRGRRPRHGGSRARGFPRGVLRLPPGPGRRATPGRGSERAKNVAVADRTRRYEIDPLELLHADDDARTRGLDLVGIYHSHPNHPAAPSEFDRSRASLWYAYVIVGVTDGTARMITAWRLDETSEQFLQEEIVGRGTKARSRGSRKKRLR